MLWVLIRCALVRHSNEYHYASFCGDKKNIKTSSLSGAVKIVYLQT